MFGSVFPLFRVSVSSLIFKLFFWQFHNLCDVCGWDSARCLSSLPVFHSGCTLRPNSPSPAFRYSLHAGPWVYLGLCTWAWRKVIYLRVGKLAVLTSLKKMALAPYPKHEFTADHSSSGLGSCEPHLSPMTECWQVPSCSGLIEKHHFCESVSTMSTSCLGDSSLSVFQVLHSFCCTLRGPLTLYGWYICGWALAPLRAECPLDTYAQHSD